MELLQIIAALQATAQAVTSITALAQQAQVAFADDPDLPKLQAALAELQAANNAAFSRVDDKLSRAADQG